MKTGEIVLKIILFFTFLSFSLLITARIKIIDHNLLDYKTEPGDNFYQFVNGKSIKNIRIPDSMGKWGSINELVERNNKKIRYLFDQIIKNNKNRSGYKKKIFDLYKTGLNKKKINSSGLISLKPELKMIEGINNTDHLLKTIIHFQKIGINTVFDIFSDKDRTGRDLNIPWLYQPELTLPDKSYYIKNNKRFIEIRKKYKLFISRVFQLSGEKKVISDYIAGMIIDMEKTFANFMMNLNERQNPVSTCNIISITELQQLSRGINWGQYFKMMDIPVKFMINVSQPGYFKKLGELINEYSIEKWKYLLKWKLINYAAPFLNNRFVKENFKFFGKFLKGERSLPDHKEIVINKINRIMGDAIGHEFIDKYYNAESVNKVMVIFQNLKKVFRKRIMNLHWMENKTRLKAIEKLNDLKIKAGYPKKWIDYSSLEIKDDYFIRNIFRINKFNFKNDISTIGNPVDRSKWNISPQSINAYYSPYLNEIVIPAAILEPPFFYKDHDNAINYATIGIVIAHEMTHAFDNYGKLFDKEGNLKNWWSDNDNIKFNALCDKLTDQYNEYFISGTIHLNGKITLAENIADIGGLTISFNAFRSLLPEVLAGRKNGLFSDEQRFFIAYAQLWQERMRKKTILVKNETSVHPPGKYRTLGPLSNFSPFYKAFNVKKKNKMFRNIRDRIIIW
ncbi:MAG: M13 family metallopeptidase [Acidobacteriota bacterium]